MVTSGDTGVAHTVPTKSTQFLPSGGSRKVSGRKGWFFMPKSLRMSKKFFLVVS